MTINSYVTVGTTSTFILEAFTGSTHPRTEVILVNTDPTNNVYLSFNAPAVVGSGTILYANGGALDINKAENEGLLNSSIYGIAAGGTGSNVTLLAN